MLKGTEANNHGLELIETGGELTYLDQFINDNTHYLVSEDTSSYYSFSFTGNQLGLNVIIGPTGGRIIIEIDGKKTTYTAFDSYCSYWRKQSPFYYLSSGEHFVKIYLSSNTLSLAQKKVILSEANKIDLNNNTSKYNKNELIFSDIFLVDDLTYHYYDTIIFVMEKN